MNELVKDMLEISWNTSVVSTILWNVLFSKSLSIFAFNFSSSSKVGEDTKRFINFSIIFSVSSCDKTLGCYFCARFLKSLFYSKKLCLFYKVIFSFKALLIIFIRFLFESFYYIFLFSRITCSISSWNALAALFIPFLSKKFNNA